MAVPLFTVSDCFDRSAFFFFCGEFRAEIKEKNPDYTVGDIAKELGKRWEKVRDSLFGY